MKNLLSHFGISLLKLVAFLPFGFFYRVSDLIFLMVWYVAGYRKKVVSENLRKSFPEKTEGERRKIAKKYYRHFSDLLIESAKGHRVPLEEIRKKVVFKNPEILARLYRQGKDVILISGHYGNWEMLFDIVSCSPHQYNVLYKPLNNAVFDQYIRKTRSVSGIKLLPMDDAYRVIAQAKKQGIRTVTYFIADQAPLETKYWTIFLNQETPVYLGPEKIARKLGMAVVFMDIMKPRRGRYEVIYTKICDDASTIGEHEITNAHVRLLEKTIREKPEHWLWSHRRWKRIRPEGVELV
ncbi:MAG: lipid A biosynthesis acyltransferase [Prolixibacteraceae bacterium]|jgi:KDO2-lipid IV(A) lauroyltransferase|nr:lipid A biosynthesis acyltransferase [Prolixibacteraceae bacterium]